MRRLFAFTLCAVLVFATPAQAGTVTTNLSTKIKIWVFVADVTGPVTIAVTLAKTPTVIFLVLDTGADPLLWCAGVSTDRIVRCEFPAIGGVGYAIGMATISGKTKMQMNVRGSRSESVSRGAGDELRQIDPANASAEIKGAMEKLRSRVR